MCELKSRPEYVRSCHELLRNPRISRVPQGNHPVHHAVAWRATTRFRLAHIHEKRSVTLQDALPFYIVARRCGLATVDVQDGG